MKALISPIEPRETGYRVAQVTEQAFLIAEPLFWIDCADDVVADQFWYDPAEQAIKEVVIEAKTDQPVVTGAQTL